MTQSSLGFCGKQRFTHVMHRRILHGLELGRCHASAWEKQGPANGTGLWCTLKNNKCEEHALPASNDRGSHKGSRLRISCLLTNGCGCIASVQLPGLKTFQFMALQACSSHDCETEKKANCKVKLPALNAFQLLSDDGIANILLTKLRNLKLPPERSCNSTVLSVSGCFLVRLMPMTLHFTFNFRPWHSTARALFLLPVDMSVTCTASGMVKLCAAWRCSWESSIMVCGMLGNSAFGAGPTLASPQTCACSLCSCKSAHPSASCS